MQMNAKYSKMNTNNTKMNKKTKMNRKKTIENLSYARKLVTVITTLISITNYAQNS